MRKHNIQSALVSALLAIQYYDRHTRCTMLQTEHIPCGGQYALHDDAADSSSSTSGVTVSVCTCVTHQYHVQLVRCRALFQPVHLELTLSSCPQ
jgi:hypothetical protein